MKASSWEITPLLPWPSGPDPACAAVRRTRVARRKGTAPRRAWAELLPRDGGTHWPVGKISELSDWEETLSQPSLVSRSSAGASHDSLQPNRMKVQSEQCLLRFATLSSRRLLETESVPLSTRLQGCRGPASCPGRCCCVSGTRSWTVWPGRETRRWRRPRARTRSSCGRPRPGPWSCRRAARAWRCSCAGPSGDRRPPPGRGTPPLTSEPGPRAWLPAPRVRGREVGPPGGASPSVFSP